MQSEDIMAEKTSFMILTKKIKYLGRNSTRNV